MEFVDLYDKNRKKLNRTKNKYEVFDSNEFMIIVHTCIFNSNHQMLVQKRANDKKDFPGKWDISSGGAVIAGETSSEAARRELYEELGIDISLEQERVYLTIHYDKGFDDYYFIHMDKNIKEFQYSKDEVLGIKWATKEEINEMMKNKDFVTYNEGFIELLFSMSTNRGTYDRRK